MGVKYRENHVGVLNEISFFMDEFSINSIVGYLRIEGSSDNFVNSVEVLAEVGEEVHEGWNYYKLVNEETGEEPKYQYYRLKSNSTASGCNRIGEIHYFGHEVIDDESDSYQCAIELVELTADASGQVSETKTSLG